MPIATPSRKWSFAYHESHILTWRFTKRQVGMPYECWLLQAAGNCWFHTNAATDSIAKLPLIPGQSCHRFHGKAAPHGAWSGDDAGRTPRYPASFSTSEGGADACTEVSHASSLRGVASQMGPGPE